MSLKLSKKHRVNGSSGSSHSKNDLIFYICLLALPLLQVGIFYFGVNFQSFFMAFQRYDTVNGKFIFDASQNFKTLANDISQQGFWIMMKNSLVLWVVGTIVGTFLAVFFSYYVYKRRTAYNFFKFVLFLPSVLPGIILITMFKTFMSEGVPAWAKFLFNAEVGDVFLNGKLRFTVITIYGLWLGFGSSVLVYTGAMDQIPTEVIEAGKIDGVSTLREFFSIIIPSILPTMATFLIAGVAGIFTNQNGLFSFVGGNAMPNDKTIGYYLYIMVLPEQGKGTYGYASLLGLICTCLALPLTYLVRRILRKVQD